MHTFLSRDFYLCLVQTFIVPDVAGTPSFIYTPEFFFKLTAPLWGPGFILCLLLCLCWVSVFFLSLCSSYHVPTSSDFYLLKCCFDSSVSASAFTLALISRGIWELQNLLHTSSLILSTLSRCILQCVLALPGIELILFLVAGIVLWFGLDMRIITHGCFSCC